MESIKIRGARVHNLKNVDLDIPKNKLVVFTGVSGSGKSSLAFDTIYAEGQRRYVESLSAYARQFLGLMEKPDVDLIEGLSPAISIDQKSASSNPRSTVGTVTEIYDYLRLLFARIGHPHCPNCGREVHQLSPEEIAKIVFRNLETTVEADKNKPLRLLIVSPVVRQRKGEFRELLDNLRSKGYERVRIDGYYHSTDDDLFILKNNKHDIYVIVDRISVDYKYLKEEKNKVELYSRIFKALEQALLLADGLVIVGEVMDAALTFVDSPKEVKETLYSERLACPNCNISMPELEPRLFSFNSPIGACPRCKGLGSILRVDQSKLINTSLSIAEGGLFPFQKILFLDTWFSRLFREMLKKYGIDSHKPLSMLTSSQEKILYHGSPEVLSVRGTNRDGNMTTIYEKWAGIIGEIEKKYYEADSEYSRADLEKYMQEHLCPECKGAKLKPEALSVTISDQNIHQFTEKTIDHSLKFLGSLNNGLGGREQQIAHPVIKELQTRMQFLINVGLEYLSLARKANTLSGGEAQRIRLASQIGTGLTGITYVLDEPSIGLHPRDIDRLLTALIKMRDLNNTVIVVEHDWETIRAADYLVDFGPRAGKNGGLVIFAGLQDEIRNCKESLTGNYLSGKRSIPKVQDLKPATSFMTFRGCSQNNLKHINVQIPLGKMVGITGVSGSGKSSLLLDTIYPVVESQLNKYYKGPIGQLEGFGGIDQIQRVVLVDQSPIGRTPRSNPATYTGAFTYIREIFAEMLEAKALGYKPGRFSFNVKGGRCENCLGAGVIKVEMQFLADVYVKCDVCQGRRYNSETLNVTYKGKSIDQVLALTIDEAYDLFENHWKIRRILKTLQDVGLGYMELGQAATTLSGGEAQRVKLAKELYTNLRYHTLYLLDEPTTGLHMEDIRKLLKVLRELVKQNNTIILIEHNYEVIKNCDYLIDLGPEGGEGGGSLVYQGPTDDILKNGASYTGKYYAEFLKPN